MGIGGVLGVMWRRKLVVLAIAAAVIGAAGWSLSTQPNIYESGAKVALLPDPANPELVPFYGQAVENLLPTYAQIVESRSFLGGVVGDLPFPMSDVALDRATRAQPVTGVGVLEVVGSSEDPVRAQQMAAATATALVERLARNGIVNVTVLDEARVPPTPSSPRPRMVYGVATVFGLLLGALGALGWDRYFVRIRSVADLSAIATDGVLAVLPEVRKLRGRRVVIGDPALVELEEALRSLRTNVFFKAADLSKGTTIITGISPGDGKSTVAANLAVLTAELGGSVVLIDADVHRPVQHEIFGLSNDVGLSSAILDGVPLEQLALPTKYPNLRVMPAGPPLSSRAEELRLYLEALPGCSSLGEVVLVDSPPIGAADEVRMLAAFSARVVLLVRSGSVTARQVQQTIESLRVVDAKLLGLVLSRGKKRDTVETMSYYRDYRRRDEELDSSSDEESRGERLPAGPSPEPPVSSGSS